MDNYTSTRSSILNQRVEGKYISHHPSSSYKTFLILGIMNLGLGLSSILTYANLYSFQANYTESTTLSIYLPKGTAYLYINIEGLYQNYLPYIKSINYNQIKGKTDNLNLTDTKPYDFLDDKPYYPAGAIAETFFQDRIMSEELKIETSNISWKSESSLIGFTEYRPKDIAIPDSWTPMTNQGTVPLNTVRGSGLPILNERFANWIALSAFGSFKKLWGRIQVPKDGNYTFDIESTYEYGKSKGIFISYKNPMGIPTYYAMISFITIGVAAILFSYYIRRYGY